MTRSRHWFTTYVYDVIEKVSILSRVALEKYSPRLALGSKAHMDNNRKFFKVLANTFYSNKQHRTTGSGRENTVKSFMKNQRNKEQVEKYVQNTLGKL